jgi:hypothetical protein
MAVFAADTFTGADGTAIVGGGYTASDGGTWSEHPNELAGTACLSDANACRTSAAGLSMYIHSATPGGAEYDVELDVICKTAASPADVTGPAGRILTAARTYYFGNHSRAGATWELRKFVGGVNTLLGSSAGALTAGVTYHAKLEIRNAAKKLFVDGVELISSADNVIAGAGQAGFRQSSAGAAMTNSNGYHADSFVATDLTAGGAGTPYYYDRRRRAA